MNKNIKGILNNSFKETFKGKFWKFFTGTVATIGFILFFAKNYFGSNFFDSIKYGIYFFIALIFLRFFSILFRNSYRYYIFIKKESIYGNAIILLKESFSKAHYYRKTPGHQDDKFMETMISFCVNLKKIFDTKTRAECSVSIKVPLKEYVDESTTMENLCRDPKHHKIRDTEVYKNTKHTIIGNTAFRIALNNVLKNSKKKYYINNHISQTPNYDNTSKECYPDGKLNYESELVYPIIPIINDDKNHFKCHGFLCVDCDKPDAFNESYDVAIVEGVSDGIYDIISLRNMNKYKDNNYGKR